MMVCGESSLQLVSLAASLVEPCFRCESFRKYCAGRKKRFPVINRRGSRFLFCFRLKKKPTASTTSISYMFRGFSILVSFQLTLRRVGILKISLFCCASRFEPKRSDAGVKRPWHCSLERFRVYSPLKRLCNAIIDLKNWNAQRLCKQDTAEIYVC